MPQLTYLGHSSFQLRVDDYTITIDPFLTGNPQASVAAADVKTDWIFLTHGHNDHFGDDALAIAKANDATIIAPFELATYCEGKGAKAHPMHIGGSHAFPFGRVKLTIAHHGSAYVEADGTIIPTGNPCGVLFTTGDKTFYHAGDTGLFLDMQLIGERNKIDLAALPIGDNFTMGIDDAVTAAQYLKADKVIPIHYNTFDVIQANPAEFAEKVQSHGIDAEVLSPGGSIDY